MQIGWNECGLHMMDTHDRLSVMPEVMGSFNVQYIVLFWFEVGAFWFEVGAF